MGEANASTERAHKQLLGRRHRRPASANRETFSLDGGAMSRSGEGLGGHPESPGPGQKKHASPERLTWSEWLVSRVLCEEPVALLLLTIIHLGPGLPAVSSSLPGEI